MLKFDSSLLTTSRILQPLWNRMPPEIKMIVKVAGTGMPRDDEIHIVSVSNQVHALLLMQITRQNSQSGSQWDGLRHYGITEHGVFYNK